MKKIINILLLASIVFFMANKSQAQEKDLRPLFEKYNIGIYNQGTFHIRVWASKRDQLPPSRGCARRWI